MKVIFLFFFLSIWQSIFGQGVVDIIQKNQWILVTDKLEKKKEVNFVSFQKKKIELNAMIWSFLDNGKIEYDYQSADNIEACNGVDFLDLDIENSYWKYNNDSQVFTLTLKGGYASIDDFVLKAEYIAFLTSDEFGNLGFQLKQTKVLTFRDLTKLTRKK
jgi:hypothetical protein